MSNLPVIGQRIAASATLDEINVFWCDFEPYRGSVTITCWGNAWTAYFGGMAPHTIRQFFEKAGTDYLVSKLGISQVLAKRKQNDKHLARIIDRVKLALVENGEGERLTGTDNSDAPDSEKGPKGAN